MNKTNIKNRKVIAYLEDLLKREPRTINWYTVLGNDSLVAEDSDGSLLLIQGDNKIRIEKDSWIFQNE